MLVCELALWIIKYDDVICQKHIMQVRFTYTFFVKLWLRLSCCLDIFSASLMSIFILHPHPHLSLHDSGRVLWFHVGCLCVRPSVRQSYIGLSICISLPNDNLSKRQWIFTKLSMCIDIVDIWFGIANGQISSNFYGVICPRHTHIFVSGW